jgi:hypothetical protein
VDAPFLVENSDLEHAETEEAENDDQHTADPLQPYLVVVERAPKCGGTGAEQDEDERKPPDEEQGVEERKPAAPADFGKRHPGDEPYVGWHQGEHTRRQEAEQPGDKGHHKTQRPRFSQSGPSSRCRHSRHTP